MDLATRGLQVVRNELPDPPYPEDTEANGYKPEFNISRIKQSRTWLLAAPEVRPWLLMLWAEAWSSTPVGSYEDDLEYIAARIGCSVEWLEVHRKILLRGWERHSDGRLYHPYVVNQVSKMLKNRRNNAARQARWRNSASQGNNASVTRYERVSNAAEQEQEQEQEYKTPPICPPYEGGNQLPLEKPEPKPEKTQPNTSGKKNSYGVNLDKTPPGISQDAAKEFVQHRKLLKKPLTQNAFDRAMSAALRAASQLNISPDEAIHVTVDAGWQGINPDWIKNRLSGGQHETRQRDDRSRAKRFADKLDEIARRDIEAKGFTDALD